MLKPTSTNIEARYGQPSTSGQMDDGDCYCVGGALVMFITDQLDPDYPKPDASRFPTDMRWPDEMHIAMHVADFTGQSLTDIEVETMMGCPAFEVLQWGFQNVEVGDLSDRARLIYIEACDIIEHNDAGRFEEAWQALDRAFAIGDGDLAQSRYLDDLSYPVGDDDE